MNVTDHYVLFWGGIFSNFANTPYTAFDGKKFTCSEQEFMYRKACLFDDYGVAEQILKTSDPKQIKKLGRLVKGYRDTVWGKVRYEVMYNACKAKFSTNRQAYKKLMSYPGKTFAEASPYDTIWGIGLGEDDPKALDESTWRGQNLLGKVLTQIRNEFEKEEQ